MIGSTARLAGLVGVTLLVSAGSCQARVLIPIGAEQFDPQSVYERWWRMIEACTKRRAPFSSVTWYRVPYSEFVYDGHPAAGAWDPSRNVIFVAHDQLENGALVRHEMLHAVLRERGHPQEYFLDACASLVICSVCGPWKPPAGYVVLPPDSLRVASSAKLLDRERDGQRWVALEITVSNDRDRAVVVAAPGDPVYPRTFAFTVSGLSSGEVAHDSSTLYFAPFATKSWLYEFLVSADLTRYHIPPGIRRVRGGYARSWGRWDTVHVSP